MQAKLLKTDIHQFRFLIEKELEGIYFDLAPKELYDPIRYTLSPGGKKTRSVLLLMACQMFKGSFEEALPAAVAVELFHNFSLVHDDIMDAASLRRNKMTIHEKWDKNTAILSGDSMLVKSFQMLGKCNPVILPRILALFSEAALKVCEGQQLDMIYESNDKITIEEYLHMIELKTSALLAVSLELGALTGGASDENADYLRRFGNHLGIAFQLQDDILDVYGVQERIGKKLGGDILAGKKTFLLVMAMELANPLTLDKLHTILNDDSIPSTEKIKEIKHIYDIYKVKEAAKNEIFHHHSQGMKWLDKINVSENRKNGLKALSENLMNRDL